MPGIYENVGFYLTGTGRKELSLARRAGRTPPDEPGDWPFADFFRDPDNDPDNQEDDDLIFA